MFGAEPVLRPAVAWLPLGPSRDGVVGRRDVHPIRRLWTIGCCDSSPERHARAHFVATGHPVIRSIEPGESWSWCYPDSAYLGSMPNPS